MGRKNVELELKAGLEASGAFPVQVLLVTHSDHGVREAQVLTSGIRAWAWSAGNRNLTGRVEG